MTISYNWLCDYLPEHIEIDRLSKILTSIGLEVESVTPFESIKGGLKGLVIGEVLTCTKHPNADKLSLTTVNIGTENPLHIVCGASNVAAGQKVVVAPIGTTIYPTSGEPLTMEKRKIRGELSEGMICAEDEIGLSTNHDGILVLNSDVVVGKTAAEHFKPYTDFIIEIGLTPNHMDAMSHLGVARDVCAYLTHHDNKEQKVKFPYKNNFKADNNNLQIEVNIASKEACARYAGVTISGVKVAASPQWLKERLQAVGVRSINNIVDITNYVLHETGQPLHAFDANKIEGNKIIVDTLESDTNFLSLDEKERKLLSTDLCICDGNKNPMCIAGVFGGLNSGVTNTTTNIFLESAWFNPQYVRATSMHHGLRTDAATRFEKGVDISNTVNVLKRAALLIKEIAGGEISSDVVDVFEGKEKTQVALKYHYLKKLSGKNYHPDAVKKIFTALDFEIVKEGIDSIWVAVPHSKPDISLPADLVEEILRIDGLDNIEIPSLISISPAINTLSFKENIKEKIANYLVGLGFSEIVTNSITNSKYYNNETLNGTVKMMNNLSADLDVLRPSMLETGLETLAYNYNRKNTNLRFFEIGKTYGTSGIGNYFEEEHVAIFISGERNEASWQNKPQSFSFYDAKGITQSICSLLMLPKIKAVKADDGNNIIISSGKKQIATIKTVSSKQLQHFDIKQQVFFIDFNLDALIDAANSKTIIYKEVSKFPSVQRDLALLLDKKITYESIETSIKKNNISKLQAVKLFDIFESEKLGNNKKSLAVNFTFLDEEKTLTDKEIDGMMQKIISSLEKDVEAVVRGN
ncbi:MAG: phenylalanine--tRNA ligase subunit beta [Chitinophagaceae bacterium]